MNTKAFIGTILGIAMLVALVMYFSGGDKNYLWEVRLRHDRYEPYDIGLYIDVLEESFGEEYEHILKSKQFETVADSGVGTMLYIDEGIGLTNDHINLLMGFIERGNTAIFSSNIIPENLIERITDVDFDIEYSQNLNSEAELAEASQNAGLAQLSFLNKNDALAQNEDFVITDDSLSQLLEDYDIGYDLYINDSTVTSQFLAEPKNSYKFSFLQKDSLENYDWSGIPKPLYEEYNETNKFEQISIIEDSIIDIISMNHGDGKLIIHMNPIFFSNLYFKEEFGYDYAKDIVSLFGDGKVYFNQHYTYLAPITAEGTSNSRDYESESPLMFLLKHKGLKWAIFSMLGLSLIYLLFSLKRQLPVLAYFKKPKNTSISYVQALSGFYSNAENATLLCDELMTDFKHFLRTRYHIKTNIEKEELIPIISRNSGISQDDINRIFDKEFKINYGEDSKKKGTVDLYKLLEKFYQNCK